MRSRNSLPVPNNRFRSCHTETSLSPFWLTLFPLDYPWANGEKRFFRNLSPGGGRESKGPALTRV
jgi:hypothetical protein